MAEPQELLMGSQGTTATKTAEKQSPWPMILGLLAAGEGNYGPLFQQMEQRRKTRLATQFNSVFQEVNRRASMGDFEGATTYLNEQAGQFGARAPEMMPFVQQTSDFLKAKQENQRAIETWFGIESAYAKNSPNYPKPKKAVLDMVGAALKSESHIRWDVLKEQMLRHKFDTRYIGATRSFVDPESGYAIDEPITQFTQTSQLQGVIANTLAARYEKQYGIALSPADLANIDNNKPVFKEGLNITPMVGDNIRRDIAKMRGTERDIELRKMLPLGTSVNESLEDVLRASGSKDPLLDMARGNYEQRDLRAARDSAQQRLIQVAEAPIIADLRKNIAYMNKAGLSAVNLDIDSDNFGVEVPGVSHEYVLKQGGRLGYLRQSLIDKRVTPALQALKGLQYAERMMQELGDPDDFVSQLTVGTSQLLQAFLGVPFSKETTMAQAARMIFNRVVEKVENTETINDASVGQLKNYIAGPFANAEHVKSVVPFLGNRIKENLQYYMQGVALPIEELPKDINRSGGVDPSKTPEFDMSGAR